MIGNDYSIIESSIHFNYHPIKLSSSRGKHMVT